MADTGVTPDPERSKTMAEVVAALKGSYTDDGLARYLLHGRLIHTDYDDVSPIEACATADGRWAVWAFAEATNEGVFL